MTYKELRREARSVMLAVEQKLLLVELEAAGWCIGNAARRMGCSTSTLSHAISRHPTLRRMQKYWGIGDGRPHGKYPVMRSE